MWYLQLEPPPTARKSRPGLFLCPVCSLGPGTPVTGYVCPKTNFSGLEIKFMMKKSDYIGVSEGTNAEYKECLEAKKVPEKGFFVTIRR